MPALDESTTVRWWWVRHAPVPDGGRIYGQHDLDCDCGDADVFAALARVLPTNALWIVSNLARTRQTAAAISAAMGDPPEARAPLVVPELAEQHLGEWQGQVRADFYARRTVHHNFWFGPADQRAPGGETFVELVDRAAVAIARLTDAHPGRDIVAVSHGGTIRAALAFALKLEPEACLAFVMDNCSLTRLDHLGGDARYHWRVAAVNHRPWLGRQTPADGERTALG